METYAKGHPRKDAPASAAMMTDKTAFFEPHFPAMTGKDAVVKFLAMAFEQFDVEMIPVVTDVQVEGNLAIMHGTYTQKLTPKVEGAAAMPDSGNWTVAARRQADGSWKWDWIMGASDRRCPEPPLTGPKNRRSCRPSANWHCCRQARHAHSRPARGEERNLFEDGQAVDVAKATAEYKSGAIRIDSDIARDLRVYISEMPPSQPG